MNQILRLLRSRKSVGGFESRKVPEKITYKNAFHKKVKGMHF